MRIQRYDEFGGHPQHLSQRVRDMQTLTDSRGAAVSAPDVTTARSDVGPQQAYSILHVGFTIAPIVAGIDKFTHLLTNWDQYLAPWIANLSPVGGHSLMLAV